MNEKVRTARLSIISNSILILLKITAGILSGSISLISEAIHSIVDLFASLITFFSVKISDKPPDKEHPYGHGKFENISGTIEAILVFLVAIFIIYKAIFRIIKPRSIEFISVAFSVMFISSIINFFVSKQLYKTAKKTNSIALQTDAFHLRADVYTSLGVFAGLILIQLTNLQILDPIIAIIVSLFILKGAYKLFKTAVSPLVDTNLPDEDIETIKNCIKNNISKNMSFHQLRTRKSGHINYADFHLVVQGNITVKQAHDICNLIETDIKNKINDTEVTIHVEPWQKV